MLLLSWIKLVQHNIVIFMKYSSVLLSWIKLVQLNIVTFMN